MLCHTGLVWKTTIGGRVLTFHLAGINNQNFLMRDEETGSFWQQVTGKCLSGPLVGRQLELARSEEVTFALWKQESPAGTVLAADPKFLRLYPGPDWESQVQKLHAVVTFSAPDLPPRELVVGIELDGTAKAYPVNTLRSETLAQDRLAGTPLLLALGPDDKSIRAFIRRIPGNDEADFYKMSGQQWAMVDSATASLWDFRGCAFSGPARGKCLAPVWILKDYWFDWREYHPETLVFRR